MATMMDDRDGLEVAVEEREAWKRRLTITVAPERVARARERELRKVRDSVKLKGFRKGRVPPQVIEQRYGPLVDERTVNSLVSDAYRQALEGEALEPVGEPTFGQVRYEPGESLTFQVELEVMPDIRLQRVGGFRIRRPEFALEEGEVRDVIERLREERAVWEPVERGPEEGDRVSVRIARRGEEGEADETPEGRAYRFELGAGYAIPEVEEAIRSLEAGGSGEFEVTFPEDFDDPEMAGKTQTLRIELQEVKSRRLPALDDQFASEVGDFDSLGALEDAIREDLVRHKERESRDAVRDRIVDALIEANPFEVPRAMVDRYLERVIDAPEDADPEQLENARRSLRPAAERQIKRHLILEHLIEREGLEATDEELEDRVRETAERRGTEPRRLRQRLAREKGLETLRNQIAVEKVFGYLESLSEIE